jgi:hypothetical protein
MDFLHPTGDFQWFVAVLRSQGVTRYSYNGMCIELSKPEAPEQPRRAPTQDEIDAANKAAYERTLFFSAGGA